jgi:hypothetical protein
MSTSPVFAAPPAGCGGDGRVRARRSGDSRDRHPREQRLGWKAVRSRPAQHVASGPGPLLRFGWLQGLLGGEGFPIDLHGNPDSDGALPMPVAADRYARQLLLEMLDPLESGEGVDLPHLANMTAARTSVCTLHDNGRQLAVGTVSRALSTQVLRATRTMSAHLRRELAAALCAIDNHRPTCS